MEDSRWPKTPQSRRKSGRPEQSWKNQMTDFMRTETWKKMWLKMDISGVWEWIDGPLLYRS
jgi:hypothetical protein